jgi:anti-sigma factor RsiW
MNEPPLPDSPPSANADDETLVAYLDGELSESETAQLEARLANEPALRDRLHSLQQTWDLLDSLPAVRTPEHFTRSTIEFAVRQVATESPGGRTWLNRWLPLLLSAAATALTGTVTYQAVRTARNAPYRELVRDLRVIENFDLYRTVDRNLDFVEFLTKLDQAQLFSPRETDRE